MTLVEDVTCILKPPPQTPRELKKKKKKIQRQNIKSIQSFNSIYIRHMLIIYLKNNLSFSTKQTFVHDPLDRAELYAKREMFTVYGPLRGVTENHMYKDHLHIKKVLLFVNQRETLEDKTYLTLFIAYTLSCIRDCIFSLDSPVQNGLLHDGAKLVLAS